MKFAGSAEGDGVRQEKKQLATDTLMKYRRKQ
jgi:hypothetical protein